jgi:hypothetical protein
MEVDFKIPLTPFFKGGAEEMEMLFVGEASSLDFAARCRSHNKKSLALNSTK